MKRQATVMTVKIVKKMRKGILLCIYLGREGQDIFLKRERKSMKIPPTYGGLEWRLGPHSHIPLLFPSAPHLPHCLPLTPAHCPASPHTLLPLPCTLPYIHALYTCTPHLPCLHTAHTYFACACTAPLPLSALHIASCLPACTALLPAAAVHCLPCLLQFAFILYAYICSWRFYIARQ